MERISKRIPFLSKRRKRKRNERRKRIRLKRKRRMLHMWEIKASGERVPTKRK